MNVSFFQLAPVFYPDTLPIAAGWLCRTPPTGRVGDTWYHFGVPGKPEPVRGTFLDSAPFLQNRGYAPATGVAEGADSGPSRKAPSR